MAALPFGGVAEVDEHGNRPFREEFIVIISGPLQHLCVPEPCFLINENKCVVFGNV